MPLNFNLKNSHSFSFNYAGSVLGCACVFVPREEERLLCVSVNEVQGSEIRLKRNEANKSQTKRGGGSENSFTTITETKEINPRGKPQVSQEKAGCVEDMIDKWSSASFLQ